MAHGVSDEAAQRELSGTSVSCAETCVLYDPCWAWRGAPSVLDLVRTCLACARRWYFRWYFRVQYLLERRATETARAAA